VTHERTAARHLIFLGVLCLAAAECKHDGAVQETGGSVPPASSPATPVAITSLTIVDVVSGRLESDQTLVTKAGEIVAIGPGLPIPTDAVRVDGAGKFLIPGLWDMHAHHQATGTASLDLYLANGVVGTRDMGADVDFILPLRDRIKRGDVQGPEIIAAGPILDDRPPDWPFRRHITNAQEARQAVKDLKASGVDFIKVHDGTPRDAFFAIAEEAPRVGLTFAGHVPMHVTVEEAVNAGIKSIEHLANGRVFADCSENDRYITVACQPRFAALAAKGVWQAPTLAFFAAIPDLFAGKPMAHQEYASDSLLELTRRNAKVSNIDENGLARFRVMSHISQTVVRDLGAAGNGILAGCDGLVPGFCLHDELEAMTTGGLSALQAMQTATINPARFLGREKTQGSIEVGKRADLVLLEANPLTDIRNTRRVAAVLVRGRLLTKAAIDQMLAARRRITS
jgi:imidazolonepropionase-like amidohydrolase